MDEDEVNEAIEQTMVKIDKNDAMDSGQPRSVSRDYLNGIIEGCQSRLACLDADDASSAGSGFGFDSDSDDEDD